MLIIKMSIVSSMNICTHIFFTAKFLA
jgi:hypothetical protein